jgi:hypothetical protein
MRRDGFLGHGRFGEAIPDGHNRRQRDWRVWNAGPEAGVWALF